MMMTPLEKYQHDLQQPDFHSDPAQYIAVQHTQHVYDNLLATLQQENKTTYLDLLKKKFTKAKHQPVKGLYFWGGVGRGKTYLVDNFFACLPIEKKMRLHFHRFMQMVHEELKKLKHKQNPLVIVARHLAKKAHIICLDEFHVSDITDAMILGNLFKALFDHGVTLVTTSNIPPDELYKDGLQRQRFLPAIALLKRYTEVVNVDNGVDYRLRTLEQAEIYHSPLDTAAQLNLAHNFSLLAPDEGEVKAKLAIHGRNIQTIKCADGVVWFDFNHICDAPRAVPDYIEIAQCFNTVLLSDIPQMDDMSNDFAQRFVTLVDEFYDRNVKLIISAAEPLESLYVGKRHEFAFERTKSRLEEMQSHEYLERPHLP